jgi:hypothetical protein
LFRTRWNKKEQVNGDATPYLTKGAIKSSRRSCRRPNLKAVYADRVGGQLANKEGSLKMIPILEWDYTKKWARLQFPETVLNLQDLEWGESGKLKVKDDAAKRLPEAAALWLPHNHFLLMPFDIATARVSDECGALKILLDHWWFRRHIWVTRSRGDLMSIDGPTEVLYDSMHGDLGPRYQHYLQMRCRHEVGGYQGRCRKCSEVKIPSMRGKLDILIVLSESAVKEELAAKSKGPNSSSRGYVDFFAEMGTDHKCQCLWELQKIDDIISEQDLGSALNGSFMVHPGADYQMPKRAHQNP